MMYSSSSSLLILPAATNIMSNSASPSEDSSASSGNKLGQQDLNPLITALSPPTFPHQQQQQKTKKKRKLPGNPDPDAEVVALSPKTLMTTNRFVCEICNKGFQRDQNLQLHRRGHNLPWKLKHRNKEMRKRVYVCPEPSCTHHHPSKALGDLTGIKKHFSRKHGEKKLKCEKCTKRYAVQSDWKAHSKTCGTKEYKCDCGTLFSRRDSFVTHRAFCDALAMETERLTSQARDDDHDHDPPPPPPPGHGHGHGHGLAPPGHQQQQLPQNPLHPLFTFSLQQPPPLFPITTSTTTAAPMTIQSTPHISWAPHQNSTAGAVLPPIMGAQPAAPNFSHLIPSNSFFQAPPTHHDRMHHPGDRGPISGPSIIYPQMGHHVAHPTSNMTTNYTTPPPLNIINSNNNNYCYYGEGGGLVGPMEGLGLGHMTSSSSTTTTTHGYVGLQAGAELGNPHRLGITGWQQGSSDHDQGMTRDFLGLAGEAAAAAGVINVGDLLSLTGVVADDHFAPPSDHHHHRRDHSLKPGSFGPLMWG